jgi:hypothetical protein
VSFQLAGTKRLGSSVSQNDDEIRIHYDLTEGQGIVITYRQYSRFIEHPSGTGFFLPQVFEYLTTRHELPYAVTMSVGLEVGSSPRVLSLGVSRKQSIEVGQLGRRKAASYPALSSIKSDALRQVPVGRLLQDAIRAATHTAPGPEGIPDLMVREKDISRAYQTVVRGAVLPRATAGSRLDDAHFEDVARIYRLAVEKRERPTKAVRDAFHVGPSAAGRYVQEARRRGKLRDAPAKGLAGEIEEEQNEEDS